MPKQLVKIFLLLFFAHCAFAKPEKNQPLYIEADHASFNHSTGVSTYEGHVRVSQGKTNLWADKIVTYNNQDDELLELIANGSPAKYQSEPASKPHFLGQANTIKYHALLKQFELVGDAFAEHDHHQIQGPILLYNTEKASLVSPQVKSGRTTIVFAPKLTDTPLTRKEKS